MASIYDVLDALKNAGRPVSLSELANTLGIEMSALDGMLEFWIRKGRLRVVGPAEGTVCDVTGCATCSAAGPNSCPMVLHDPKRYEVVEPGQRPGSQQERA